jgi:hypothetical protein
MNNITFNLFKIVTVAQLSNWAINYVNIQNFPIQFWLCTKNQHLFLFLDVVYRSHLPDFKFLELFNETYY